MHRLYTGTICTQGIELKIQTRKRAHFIYYFRYIPDSPYFLRELFNGGGDEKYPSLGGDLDVADTRFAVSPQTPL